MGNWDSAGSLRWVCLVKRCIRHSLKADSSERCGTHSLFFLFFFYRFGPWKLVWLILRSLRWFPSTKWHCSIKDNGESRPWVDSGFSKCSSHVDPNHLATLGDKCVGFNAMYSMFMLIFISPVDVTAAVVLKVRRAAHIWPHRGLIRSSRQISLHEWFSAVII